MYGSLHYMSPLTSPHSTEVLSVREQGEWMSVEVAVDGNLAIPFDVHKSDWRNYPDEDSRRAMLERQALGLLDTYGDARCQRKEALCG